MTAYLKLPPKEQIDILNYAASLLNRPALVLQKDIWVVWALEQLFSIQSDVKMAFKGGTSLSKVFGVIDRFSEDVDITLDYRDLDHGIDPFQKGLSRTRLKEVITPHLRELANLHVCEVIAPCLSDAFREATNGLGRLETEKDGEEIYLYYPSGLKQGTTYLEDRIKLEFGGRNAITPSTREEIHSDIAQASFQTPLEFPTARVEVLSAQRTFWEKATLIHAECHRPEGRFDPNRKSRHWHDLYKLLAHESGQQALENRALLEDVIRFKNVFFYTGYANYDAILRGKLVLVPKGQALSLLGNDYAAMIDSGMFESTPPDFDAIVAALHEAEKRINEG